MSSAKVLIVDDDPAFLELMAIHLRKRGFYVELSHDGQEALQMMRSNGPFDVLVTDLMMPGLSGLELLRRAHKLDPLIEVIVITAGGSLEMAISALREDGAFDYLTKPLEVMGELSIAVERAVAQRTSRLEKELMHAKLLGSQQELKNLLGSTGDAIISGNERDGIMIANLAASRLLGIREIVEREASIPLPDILENHILRWRNLDENQTAMVEIPWPDGRVLLARMVPMKDGDGKRSGWVIVLRDISYQKRLEMFIVRSFTKVSARIRQPIQQARVVMSQLERSLYSDADSAKKHIEQLRHLFEMANSSSDELLALDVDSFGAAKDAETITLQRFLRNQYASVANEFQSVRQLRLRWEVYEDLPSLEMEQPILTQVFHHLLNRALMRSHAGGEIRISAYYREAFVWLEVIDSGPMYGEICRHEMLGASEAVQSQMMERSEIELAVVKMLAGRLGGQVWTRRTGEEGASVAICFPLVLERIMA